MTSYKLAARENVFVNIFLEHETETDLNFLGIFTSGEFGIGKIFTTAK